MGQNTHAPRSIVSGFTEIAPVGQTSTHAAQPSGQREESIFGFPRKRIGVEAEATSGITGCPSARLTFNALGHHDFMGQMNLVPGQRSCRRVGLPDVHRCGLCWEVRGFAEYASLHSRRAVSKSARE